MAGYWPRSFGMFMDRDEVEVHKHAKKEQMLLKEVKNAFGIQSQGCSYFIQKFDQDWNLIFLLNVNSRL